MRTSFDPDKNAANFEKHKLSLADFDGFDAKPIVVEDDRFDYGEPRLIALGRINGKPHCIVFTIRDGEPRLISFRRAHEKELRRHE